MPRLPLQFLPAFRAAAEHQSLRAAADELHVTPSAISQQMHTLEEQLGFPVFDRRGRSVVLNAAGALLLRSVQTAMAELDAGAQAAATLASSQHGDVIRLSVVPSLAQRWLLPRLQNWRSHHPDIRLEIDSSQQSRDLLRAGLHAGLRTGTGTWPGLHAVSVFELEAPLCVLGSPQAAQRLAGRGADEIARQSLLGDALLWQRWLDTAGVAAVAQPVASFADSGLLLQAAEQDLGLALGRGLLTQDALHEGRLVQLSDITVPLEVPQRYFVVFPPALAQWKPLLTFTAWLEENLAFSAPT